MQLSGPLVLIVTLAMCQVITTLEASLVSKARPILITQANIAKYGSPHTLQGASDKVANEQAVKDVQVLRDTFLMLWVCGGILPGAVVSLALRKYARKFMPARWVLEVPVSFDVSVSICTAIPLVPLLLKRYTNCAPEEAFALGFAVSVAAWASWIIVLILVARFTVAANERGIGGLKDEMLGKGGQPTILPFPESKNGEKPPGGA